MEAVFDAHVSEAMGWTPRARADMLRSAERRRSRPHILLICQRTNGDIIGSLSLGDSCGRTSIGVILGPDGRGRGMAAEALAAAIPYFALGRHELVLETAESNIAMRRVATATGFMEEARYEHLLPNRTWVDAVRYVYGSRPLG